MPKKICPGKSSYLSGPAVEPQRLKQGMSVEELVSMYRRSGAFNGGRLAEACDLFLKMIDEDVTIALTLTGAMTPAGLGGAIISAMEAGFIDFIISTGANLYHDLHFALGQKLTQGDFRVDDEELFKHGVERIYDIFITERMLLETDAFVTSCLKKYSGMGQISTSRLHRILGEEVNAASARPDLSILGAAARYDIPIFTSSPGDSSIGMNLAALKLKGGTLSIDPDLDVLETTAIVHSSPKNGALEIGGGSPKNFYMQTQPVLWQILGINKGGHDYFIQVTTDSPQWGGLSGATPSEAISWGKLDPKGKKNHVVVYCDATIAIPILLSFSLSARKPRPKKRIFQKLDGMMQDLRASAK